MDRWQEGEFKYNADPQAHLFSLRGSSRGGGGGEAFLPLGELAVGLSQSSLQLVDAGLVLLENILWLVQELLHPHGVWVKQKNTGQDAALVSCPAR